MILAKLFDRGWNLLPYLRRRLHMEHNEGRELVEYALIAVLVSLGVTLMLSGASDQIGNIWNAVANFVLQ